MSQAVELTTTNTKASKDRLRAAMAMLADRGVRHAEAAARDAAAAVIERCCAEFDRRPGKGPGWLFGAVRDGAAWFGEGGDGLRESPSQLLRAMDEGREAVA